MPTITRARYVKVDKRLAELFDKQEREKLTDDEVFEQQKLLDEYEGLVDKFSRESL
jgi:uncharacterized protein YnzC (UPF0291/DUF896 family)